MCSQTISNEHDRLKAAMFKAFADADRVCRRAGRHFTPQQHLEFNANLEAALVSYNALAVEALSQKRVKHVWKLLPKHHAATHYYDIPINPRRVACNQDEDMVGRGKKIYNNCHGITAPLRSLQRYAIVQCLRWWAELSELRFGDTC